MNNRIQDLFHQKQGNILSVFFTCGYPNLEDTRPILTSLAEHGVDLIEVGMPFSDPIADGGTIQMSSQKALENGMTLEKIFEQLEGIREEVDIPLILMGYLNPVVQYGIERFVKKAAEIGIDGLILPDLPMYEYETFYKELFDELGLSNIFLVTPQTSDVRIHKIDEISDGFIYMVSSDSTTGSEKQSDDGQTAYFERIDAMNLTSPRLIGFGIHDRETFANACRYSQGAIIGSAFIKALAGEGEIGEKVATFVGDIRP